MEKGDDFFMARRGGKKDNMEWQAYEIMQSINAIDGDSRMDIAVRFEPNILDRYDSIGKKEAKGIKLNDGVKLSEKMIFSVNTMTKYLSDIKTMGNWIKENYFQGQRFQFSKVDTGMLNGFLESKRDIDGVSSSTIKSYKASISKMFYGMEAMGWDNSKIDLKDIKDFDTGLRIPTERKLSNGQISSMINYIQENREKLVGISPKNIDFGAAMLVQSIGLRVESLTKLNSNDILLNFNGDYNHSRLGIQSLQGDFLHIRGDKGGLSRMVRIPANMRGLFEELKQKEGKLFSGLNANTYRYNLKQLTLELFGREVGCTHEFRKYWASEEFLSRKNDLESFFGRAMTREEKDSLKAEIVSELGHGLGRTGKGRTDLIKIYIDSAFV